MANLQFRARAELERRKRKKGDPVVWAQEHLGVQLWSKQEDVLRSVFSNERTIVRAAAKVGKTFTCACAVLAFLSLKEDADVIVPSSLDEDLVKEIGRLAELKTFKNLIFRTINGDWEIFSLSPRGSNRKAEDLLIVVDDVPVYPIPDDHLLWISTPVEAKRGKGKEESEGTHFRSGERGAALPELQSFEALARGRSLAGAVAAHFRISAFDSPNFTGEEFAHKNKLISQSWIDGQGWEKDSAIYRSKVLAVEPSSSIEMIVAEARG